LEEGGRVRQSGPQLHGLATNSKDTLLMIDMIPSVQAWPRLALASQPFAIPSPFPRFIDSTAAAAPFPACTPLEAIAWHGNWHGSHYRAGDMDMDLMGNGQAF
jgi:hypothetical protein